MVERGAWEVSVLPTSLILYPLSLTDPERAISYLVEWTQSAHIPIINLYSVD